ncbi:hypothetical protein BR63_19130 [Thermanaerosceptrum fracticalcis]|uniref:Uncharacterized protein n=1 Tax=Thermanaerosceptrum fracticalcis TaxID=1712410 RepID=A0A7G6E7Z3_THEFR|nr:hypothetical protein [Thermanaerosceptrum fracticalcis]QNB48197.1 hypothetical protein BR63_19130 [Thermanaerosceptrum fracticalcis]
MPTIMIAVQCPICGYYMDAVTETAAKCERCGAMLDLENVKYSDWWAERKKERARLTGIEEGRSIDKRKTKTVPVLEKRNSSTGGGNREVKDKSLSAAKARRPAKK